MVSRGRVILPAVTVCAASSIALDLTVDALKRSAERCDFAAVKLFTDRQFAAMPEGIEVIKIDRIASAQDYSRFILRDLHKHIDTSHVLIVQWDGHVLDAQRWTDAFLLFDYIGAVWPQFHDGHQVGNGGFSLRSKRLMEICAMLPPDPGVAEDVQIARQWRTRLERDHQIRFAPAKVAAQFSLERAVDCTPTFGFHGIFNVARLLGEQRLFECLDEVPASLMKPADYRATVTDLLRRRRFRTAATVVRKLTRTGLTPAMHIRIARGVFKDLAQNPVRRLQDGSKVLK